MRADAAAAVESEAQGPLRLALIGCGAITTLQHLPALRRIESAEVVAVVDQDLERARATARQFGVPHAAARLAEVEATLDAVLVATPNHLHAPIALEALRRGLDVLVEKPMALDLAEAQAMVAEARARSRVLAVGLEFRFAPGNQAIRDLLAAGTLGRLERFELRQGVIPRWPFASDYVLRRETAGGGVLFDYGAHLLDLLFYWLGEPSSVRYRDDARGGLESNAEVDLEYADGLHGFVEMSRTRNLENRVRFIGDRGVLEAEVWSVDPAIRLLPKDGALPIVGRAGSRVDFASTFERQWRDFVAAARERRPPLASGDDGALVQAWIDRCYAVRRPLRLPWEDADRAPGEVGR
jgi:predicted dehydrogenase